MSDRPRPPAPVDSPSGFDPGGATDGSTIHDGDVDAAALGFADLAESGAAPSVLPEFQNLRSRLFGDFELDTPSADLELLPPPPVTEPRVPRQVSFANGVPTAADLASDTDEATEVPETPIAEPEPAELEVEPALVPVVDEPQPEPPVPAPTPAPTPEPTVRYEPLVPSSAPVVVDESPSRRPAALYVALCTVVVAALIGGWLLLRGDGDQPAADSPQQPATSATVRASVAAVTEIDEQSVVTRQQFEFDNAVSTLTLVVPVGDPDAGTADFDPEITDIQISVPGEPTQTVDQDLAPGATLSVPLDKAADAFELSYTAGGTVVRTEPSSAHRAKALVTPLMVSTGEGSDSSVTVHGDDVLNLGCTDPTSSVACGEQTDDGWTVTPPSAATKVIAQVDLPE